MHDDDTVAGTEAGTTLPATAEVTATAAIHARYTLGGLLGRGGMGEVVSARDEQIGRQVAIKRMRGGEPDPGTVARFLREARIQGGLDHPAIVPVHEVGNDAAGAPFFVMKQLAGTTLADVIERLVAGDPPTTQEFTRQRLLRAFAEVCLAVELAHTRGIVHRDLKPANIVLGAFGEVFVLDWGIAKVIDDARNLFSDISTLDDGATSVGAILGTPGYMSPEQIEGAADLDGRADVYALGCILFEILALAPLHPRGREGLASALAGVEVAPSSRATVDVPPELDRICVRATAAARTERHATARELGREVEKFLDGDRDLALRRGLAGMALAEARAALADDPSDDRGEAMRAVGRAVALDPGAPEAPELLAKLMLTPPVTLPPEVEAELAHADLEGALATRRLTAVAGYGYLLFLPVIWWIGFAPWQLAIVGLTGSGLIVLGRAVRPGNVTKFSWIAVGLHALTVVIAARFTSPFLLAPSLALIVTMSNAMLTQLARPLTMGAIFVVALLAPLAAEQAGWISPTTAIAGNRVQLTIAVDRIDPFAATVGLPLFATGVIIFGAVLASRFIEQRRVALRQTKLQAWRLGKLVPRREA